MGVARDAPDLDAAAPQLLHHGRRLGLERVAYREHARQSAAHRHEDGGVALQLEGGHLALLRGREVEAVLLHPRAVAEEHGHALHLALQPAPQRDDEARRLGEPHAERLRVAADGTADGVLATELGGRGEREELGRACPGVRSGSGLGPGLGSGLGSGSGPGAGFGSVSGSGQVNVAQGEGQGAG